MAKKSNICLETENVKLQKENKALKQTVTSLLKEIDELKAKVSEIFEIDSEMSPEELIIEKQIKYFMAQSIVRTLSLDETRALDILLKNKRIIEDKKPKENEDEVPDNASNAELLRIVSNGEEFQKPKKKRNKSKTSD